MSVCVLKSGEDLFLRKRPEKGLLAGLWEPWHCQGYLSEADLKACLAKDGVKVLNITPIGRRHHIFTHKRWEMEGYFVECDGAEGFVQVSPKDFENGYAVPKAFSGFLEKINEK